MREDRSLWMENRENEFDGAGSYVNQSLSAVPYYGRSITLGL
jgi:hypothetical protein